MFSIINGRFGIGIRRLYIWFDFSKWWWHIQIKRKRMYLGIVNIDWN
jgi:hypothetical protein